MSSPSHADSSRKSNKTSTKPLLTPKTLTAKDNVDVPKPFSLPSNKHLLMIDKKEDFDNIIKEAADRVVMFEFFAPWCGPCKILSSKLQDMAQQYEGKLLIVKIDVDDFEDLAVEHNVTAMPTFMLMKNKRLLEQFSSSNAENLQEMVEKYAGKPPMNDDSKEETK